jgi:hypothetical protein
MQKNGKTMNTHYLVGIIRFFCMGIAILGICHIWTPPCLQAGFLSDERRVCGHISGFMMELVSFRALMVVARQLLSILTA